jgi:hypothetical protein
MRRIPMSGGEEIDVFCGSRRRYCYTRRAGVCKAIKRKYNRRFRKASRVYTHNELEACDG